MTKKSFLAECEFSKLFDGNRVKEGRQGVTGSKPNIAAVCKKSS
jgi:hypothetical protein